MAIYATVNKKNKKHQEMMVTSYNSAGDPPLEKFPKIMTQSCYGELNLIEPADQWISYNNNLVLSQDNLLDTISSQMTNTTNSSIIDENSSLNSSIYEQIPGNSSMTGSGGLSALKGQMDKVKVKWWDDLTEETTTELKEIVDQGRILMM